MTTAGQFQAAAPTTLPGTININRLRANQGTALTSAKFALSAEWGSTASISSVSGTDIAFNVVISATGTGQSAAPTVTVTFANGTWTNPPIFVVCPGQGGNSAFASGLGIVTCTATTVAVQATTFTPTVNKLYGINFIGIGV